MDAKIVEEIKAQIANNPIILYMKGSPEMPRCGFSAHACKALVDCGAKFAYVDILANPEIRQTLPIYANWPTFPQLYIQGELVGGCDIIMELQGSGELKKMIAAVQG
jgi:monothiol glutaredoxin